MVPNDVVFPNGPDLDGLHRTLAEAGVEVRAVPGGLVIPGGQATIEAEAVVFRAYFAPDLLPDAEAHEGANALNLSLATARAVRPGNSQQNGVALDHMVRADAGVPRGTLLAALRAFMRDVDAVAGRPLAPDVPLPSDGLNVSSVVAALVAGGVAAQPDPEPGFATAEHEGVRFLVDLTQPSRMTLAAYLQPPEDGTDRATRLAFANYMNGRYMLVRTKLDPEDRLVVDYPLVRGDGSVPASLASTARFFAVVALRVRQAVAQGWAHTPSPN